VLLLIVDVQSNTIVMVEHSTVATLVAILRCPLAAEVALRITLLETVDVMEQS